MALENKIHTTWIIDDDKVYVYGFRKFVIVKNFCSDVVDFDNAKEAIDILKNPDSSKILPDVIFLDINMPHMDGWDFLEKFELIKSGLDKEIVIFVISSSLDEQDIAKARNFSNIADYMSKPISIQELSFAFNKVIQAKIH